MAAAPGARLRQTWLGPAPIAISLGRHSVDRCAPKVETANVLGDIPLRDILEVAVEDTNALDRRVLEAAEVQAVWALLARHALHLDIARHRSERAFGAFFIVEVDRQHRVGDLSDGHVAHVDVVKQAAAHRVVLETQRTVESWTIHAAVVGEYVPTAARDLAPDRDAAMAITHLAVAHDDVLARHVEPTSIGVAPGFDRDAIVASVEHTTIDQHVAA